MKLPMPRGSARSGDPQARRAAVPSLPRGTRIRSPLLVLGVALAPWLFVAWVIWAGGAAFAATVAPSPPTPPAAVRTLDDGHDASPWSVFASDAVHAALRPLPTGTGGAGRAAGLCLDYDFAGVSGYAGLRRTLAIDLPDGDYRFELLVDGEGPANDIQFKLVDASGDNVWWVNRTNQVLPPSPTVWRLKKRQIGFAWGPSEDKRLRQAASVEFVVAAGAGGGGRGSLCLSRLALVTEPVGVPDRPPRVTVGAPGVKADLADLFHDLAPTPPAATGTAWRAAPGQRTLTVDFGRPREFNGLRLRWLPGRHAVDYDIETGEDGRHWQTLRRVRGSAGPTDAFFLPESETRWLRLRLLRGAGGGYALRSVEMPSAAQWPTRDAMRAGVAGQAPRGRWPRAWLGEQNYWTLVGVDGGGSRSALISEDGAIELGRGGASIEPFVLLADGMLVTWADVALRQTLRERHLPLPTVKWSHPDVELEVEAAADGPREHPRLLARYRLKTRNDDASPRRPVALVLALRPLQVNPPQQFLATQGGSSPVRRLDWRDGALRLDGQPRLLPADRPARVVAVGGDAGSVVDAIADGRALPRLDTAGAAAVVDADGGASAALIYPLALRPGVVRTIRFTAPLAPPTATGPGPGNGTGTGPGGSAVAATAAEVDQAFESVAADWRQRLGRVGIELPASQQRIADSLRSALAQILMSRDGPALQPGTRSYARTWIRDGAMMAAALLRLGETDAAREFVAWFGPHLFPNGKVPCCIDGRGADPVVENDSHGEFIYAVAELWRHTRDREALAAQWPRVAAAARYMDSLRRQERALAAADPGRVAFSGLMPASISHEGYSAKPMHSYWDDFWALRGFHDAAELAAVLGHPAEAAEFGAWRDEFAADLVGSIRLSMAQHHIDFVPGAAEPGDFDATSTTVALDPVQAVLPDGWLAATFDRYWRESETRRLGRRDWRDYTPYELRSVGALVRLGQRERAAAMLDFFFADQRPPGWNQWAEVVGRLPREPRFLGDLPHAWVASDYIRSALDLLAYGREVDQALVIAAGLDLDTLRDGVAVAGLRTHWGRLSYRITGRPDGGFRVLIDPASARPPGGWVLSWPGSAPPPTARAADGTLLVWSGHELRLPTASGEISLVP